MPKLAIAWTLKNENVSTAILGASKKEQLEETLTVIDDLEKLDDEAMEKVEGILDNKPEAPAF
jgi:aryl-alcohol dehydrogenase-like predicted oxidoreductase